MRRALIVAVVLAFASVSAALALTKIDRTARGSTSQGLSTSLRYRFDSGGARLAYFQIGWNAGCTDGRLYRGMTRVTNVPVGTRRRVNINSSSYRSPIAGGGTAHVTLSLHGTVARFGRSAHGVWKASARITRGGRTRARCSSPKLSWRVTATS